MRRFLLLLCGLLCCAAPVRAGPEASLTRAELFGALASEEPATRVAAFKLLGRHADVASLRVALAGVREVRKDRALWWTRLPGKVAEFERARAGHMEAKERLESARRRQLSSGRVRQLEGAASRARSHRLRVNARLQEARGHARVARKLLDDAAQQIGRLLARLGSMERRSALLLLRGAWLTEGTPESWLLWVDALVASDAREASDELVRVARGPEGTARRLQALALDGLVGLAPERATPLAITNLEADLETGWHLAATAIAALRDVRAKAGIPALIAFLRREGIARLRGDAHDALVALTHQKHGPYAGPWARWWKDAGPTFKVPPSEPERGAHEDASSTSFYGIHTFSDRMAFVIDLSWSMWNRSGQARRVDVALEQLRAAVGTLDKTRRFAVVWFGSSAGYWKPRMLSGSESEKRQLARWSRQVDGKGQTNAFDGLDLAFRLARKGEGRPLLDTIFFLTDGAATAGPFSETADILGELRAWCRVERIRIHCIGIGEHEPALLEALARSSRGRYVKK